jgi:hypothetical protein
VCRALLTENGVACEPRCCGNAAEAAQQDAFSCTSQSELGDQDLRRAETGTLLLPTVPGGGTTLSG